MADSLGDRMKGYERATRTILPLRIPVIIRVDGKAWHTWARGCERPFSSELICHVNAATIALCNEIQGAAFAFAQSDEISILVHNYRRLNSAAWFDNQVQKMVSIAASVASACVTERAGRSCHFDARAFVLPEGEVCNYFVWRQQDWTRNSIQMLAQSLCSHKECHKKNQAELQDMIHACGQNWNNLQPHLKRGRCASKESYEHPDMPGVTRSRWIIDWSPPLFTQERSYVEQHLARESSA